MSNDEIRKQDQRRAVASMNFCRAFLNIEGMITQAQNDSIMNKITAFQNRYKIEITGEQLNSVTLKYEDNEDEAQGS